MGQILDKSWGTRIGNQHRKPQARQTNNVAYPVLDGIAAAVPRLDEGCVLDRDGRDSHCGGMMLDGRQLKIESASKEIELKYGVGSW